MSENEDVILSDEEWRKMVRSLLKEMEKNLKYGNRA